MNMLIFSFSFGPLFLIYVMLPALTNIADAQYPLYKPPSLLAVFFFFVSFLFNTAVFLFFPI